MVFDVEAGDGLAGDEFHDLDEGAGVDVQDGGEDDGGAVGGDGGSGAFRERVLHDGHSLRVSGRAGGWPIGRAMCVARWPARMPQKTNTAWL